MSGARRDTASEIFHHSFFFLSLSVFLSFSLSLSLSLSLSFHFFHSALGRFTALPKFVLANYFPAAMLLGRRKFGIRRLFPFIFFSHNLFLDIDLLLLNRRYNIHNIIK